MKFLAVIPARGGSKGIPRKNIRLLAGKPLIAWTIEAAHGAKVLDKIVVSTDDDEIAQVAEAHNVTVIRRPVRLAQDDATTLSVLQHAIDSLSLDGYAFDAVVTLQPTSPLRSHRHIEEAVKMFSADPTADSLVSVTQVPHIYHPKSVMMKSKAGYLQSYLGAPSPTRRQDKEIIYARNGAAIYITRVGCVEKFIFGGRLLAYEMGPEESVDIDVEADLLLAERYFSNRRDAQK